MSFVDESGTDHYHYRYVIFTGIVINAVITWGAEKLITSKITRGWDERVAIKKQVAFAKHMNDLHDAE